MTHADSDLFPWVRDVDQVWHRRPAGKRWFNGHTETLCGLRVAAIEVCRAVPAAEGEWCGRCTP